MDETRGGDNKSIVDHKLLQDVVQRKIRYINSKPRLIDRDIYVLVKDFFKELLQMDFEFTHDELMDELKNVYLEASFKDRLFSFLKDLGKMEYTNVEYTQEDLKKLLIEFEFLLRKLITNHKKKNFFQKLFHIAPKENYVPLQNQSISQLKETIHKEEETLKKDLIRGEPKIEDAYVPNKNDADIVETSDFYKLTQSDNESTINDETDIIHDESISDKLDDSMDGDSIDSAINNARDDVEVKKTDFNLTNSTEEKESSDSKIDFDDSVNSDVFSNEDSAIDSLDNLADDSNDSSSDDLEVSDLDDTDFNADDLDNNKKLKTNFADEDISDELPSNDLNNDLNNDLTGDYNIDSDNNSDSFEESESILKTKSEPKKDIKTKPKDVLDEADEVLREMDEEIKQFSDGSTIKNESLNDDLNNEKKINLDDSTIDSIDNDEKNSDVGNTDMDNKINEINDLISEKDATKAKLKYKELMKIYNSLEESEMNKYYDMINDLYSDIRKIN